MSSERWRGLMRPCARSVAPGVAKASWRRSARAQSPSSTVAPAPASQSICQLASTSARPVANNCPMGIQAAISPVTKPRSRRVALRLAKAGPAMAPMAKAMPSSPRASSTTSPAAGKAKVRKLPRMKKPRATKSSANMPRCCIARPMGMEKARPARA